MENWIKISGTNVWKRQQDWEKGEAAGEGNYVVEVSPHMWNACTEIDGTFQKTVHATKDAAIAAFPLRND